MNPSADDGRRPTASPTAAMMRTTPTMRTRSPSVLPARTADREIGRERNRSMMPLLMSSASPTPVEVEANPVVCTKMPAIR